MELARPRLRSEWPDVVDRVGAVDVVRDALAGTGLDLVASCPIEVYDARAPGPLTSAAMMPNARGVIVAGGAGRALWTAFRAAHPAAPVRAEHPLDTFVARALDLADAALARARIGSRRFEAAYGATPTLDFRALGEIVGLGSMGPFGLLIHDAFGPWWALRGAWLVDVDVEPPMLHRAPCTGCRAPCRDVMPRRPPGAADSAPILLATPEVRKRCVVGQDARYTEEQIDYHYADTAAS